MTNKNNTVLYCGATDNLEARNIQHKKEHYEGFTKKYSCTKLVYFEILDHMDTVYAREAKVKRWKRDWKDKLISDFNPDWKDMTDMIEGYN